MASILERLDAWSAEVLKIDGEAALGAAVDAFYERVLVDKALERFFEGHDHAKLRRHQFNFLRYIGS
jgi:truncated hemoglobin YjbI